MVRRQLEQFELHYAGRSEDAREQALTDLKGLSQKLDELEATSLRVSTRVYERVRARFPSVD